RRPRLRAAGAAATKLRATGPAAAGLYAGLFGVSRLPARSALSSLPGLSNPSGLRPAVRVALPVTLRRAVTLRARLRPAPICLPARAAARAAVRRAAE